MVASARIGVSSATGRMEFGNPLVLYRSEPAFTPFDDEDLDIERLEGLIDGWLADSGLSENDIFAGGAITTGLAAQGGPARLGAEVPARLGRDFLLSDKRQDGIQGAKFSPPRARAGARAPVLAHGTCFTSCVWRSVTPAC